MSEPDRSVSLNSNALMRRNVSPLALKDTSVSFLPVIATPPLPLRIAVIGTTFLDSVELLHSRPICVMLSQLRTEPLDYS